MYTKYSIKKKCFYKMTVSSPALTISGVTYHSERRHSMLDLKPSQAPSIKPPHMGWKRLSKGLSLVFNENQMLWAQLSCLSRTTEQPLLKFHQEPCPSFPLAPALLRVPNQNQIKSSQLKCAEVPLKYYYLFAYCLWISWSGPRCGCCHAWDRMRQASCPPKSNFSLKNIIECWLQS